MSEHTVTNNDVDTQNVSDDNSRVTGCVKWFNNKAGYGFITVSSGQHTGDVFVHHSAVNVGEEQYRFLVQGEYVEFDCMRVDDGPHQWQASNVTGPKSGRLMCETRRAVRTSLPSQSRRDQEQYSCPQYSRSHKPVMSVSQDKRHHHLAAKSFVPTTDSDGYEWLLVRKYNRNEQSTPHEIHPQRVKRSDRAPRRVRSVVS